MKTRKRNIDTGTWVLLGLIGAAFFIAKSPSTLQAPEVLMTPTDIFKLVPMDWPSRSWEDVVMDF